MRLLSAAQGAPFTGLVISAAMLGFGAAGTVAFLGKTFLLRSCPRALVCLLFLACSTMAATTPLTRVSGHFDLFLIFFDPFQGILLAGTYILYALPFFFAGLAITLLFLRTPERIGALYATNLGGSAAGALLGLTALGWFPLASLPGLTALLPLAGAILLLPAALAGNHPLQRRSQTLALLLPGTLAILLTGTALILPGLPDPSQYKDISAALQLPQARILYSESTPQGHLTVVQAPALRYAPGLSLQFLDEPPQRPVLFNDGDYFGSLPGTAGSAGAEKTGEESRTLLDYTTRVIPYEVRPPRRVALLGGRTGNDAAHALARGVQEVTLQESHKPALRLLRETHPQWIDHLYQDPRISTTSLAIRPWLERRKPPGQSSPNRKTDYYDLIVTPHLGRFGGTSGTEAMSPRYDYTREALQAMLRRLSPRGMVSTTLWLEDPPSISLRLLTTWVAALEAEGHTPAADHIAAIQSWNTATVLVSKEPFSPEEKEAVRTTAESLGFDLLILSGLDPGERGRFHRRAEGGFFENLDAILDSRESPELRDYWFDISPRSDTAPFFFQFLDFRAVPRLAAFAGTAALPYFELGFFVALLTALQAVVAALILVAAPLCGRKRWRSERKFWTFLYFAGTGTGFIVAEIALIQETLLPLGNHLEATAVVLTLLLTSSGTGSFLSRRVQPTRPVLAGTALAAAGLILVRARLGRFATAAALGSSSALGLGILAAALVPAGLVMGMIFPLGLRRLSVSHTDHLPWACAIDSSCSVAAAAVTTLVCARIGLEGAWFLSCGAYLVVAVSAWGGGGNGQKPKKLLP
ncbi:spermidine synthase-like protein [Alkalispirochaeta americana]|nr:spermidine synthase-like protein [Alkalispirochaeta americana]